MPLLEHSAKWAADKMPKVIGPRAHAAIDYAAAAAFFGMAALFWRRSQRRPAVSCLVCGAAETLSALLTDYPGGITPALSFENHGAFDLGLTGLVASLPGLMRFADRPEARFFRLQGAALAIVAGLTDFTGTGERGQLEKLAKRTA